MANNKQPVDLILLKGNKAHLTKEEIEHRKNTEVKCDVDNIIPPTYLLKVQKERFSYLAEQLLNAKIIANLDVETLAKYVLLEEQYRKIQKTISKMDIMSDDYDKLLIRQSKVFAMVDKLGNSLCLNIIARSKVSIPKPEEKKVNKFDKFKSSKNG
ncbi:phage terminase small subunit P27 family [Clostridium gasigenes]|uniref:phage terminase small subunit P27 family n=1 Tax=Clostridium gasigenes TaxID=94869 RepID=UPI001C0BCEA2|nr:phage terminase small subunit P27 family [Clostridium gasigenes]MBU3135055.1 phage terminase small subunit P27 family [Clostridium gasigenes]